jgi:hypothetical protein
MCAQPISIPALPGPGLSLCAGLGTGTHLYELQSCELGASLVDISNVEMRLETGLLIIETLLTSRRDSLCRTPSLFCRRIGDMETVPASTFRSEILFKEWGACFLIICNCLRLLTATKSPSWGMDSALGRFEGPVKHRLLH